MSVLQKDYQRILLTFFKIKIYLDIIYFIKKGKRRKIAFPYLIKFMKMLLKKVMFFALREASASVPCSINMPVKIYASENSVMTFGRVIDMKHRK